MCSVPGWTLSDKGLYSEDPKTWEINMRSYLKKKTS